MKDELFTMTPEMPAMSPEMLARWQEEMRRNALRMKHFSEMVMNPKEPEVGPTPREEIYRTGKSRLWRYASKRTVATPLLFVPNLGISRPYIFDLMHKGSFIEHMTEQGFDFYLVDWGVFGPEDNDLTLEHAVTKILPRLARKALESSGARRCRCSATAWARRSRSRGSRSTPEFPLKNYVDMAGPIDFSQVGLFGLWLDARYFDVDRFVDTLGAIPADMVKMGFKLLKPTMDLSTNLNLWWNLWNPEYVSGFNALNKWANEYLPFPGEFFRQWVKDYYQQNRLIKGELTHGRKAGQAREHPLPGAGRGRQGGQHRSAGLRPAADPGGLQHGQGVRRASGRPHLAHRRTRRLGALLAEGLQLARGAVVARRRIMADNTGTQQLFDLWKKQVDEGTQAWLKMAGQGQPVDPQAFWRPFMDQGMQAWSKVMTQGTVVARPHDAVEAVPRPVDRGVVEGPRAVHGHGELRPGHGQAARGLPLRRRRR